MRSEHPVSKRPDSATVSTGFDARERRLGDNEIRLVQAALRRLGIYSGQVDGILGPDTHGAIEDYQVKNKLPVTGQPDRGLSLRSN
jgi:peptidoglycan hydrolase-like protein with peptidoglycan-binding domain